VVDCWLAIEVLVSCEMDVDEEEREMILLEGLQVREQDEAEADEERRCLVLGRWWWCCSLADSSAMEMVLPMVGSQC